MKNNSFSFNNILRVIILVGVSICFAILPGILSKVSTSKVQVENNSNEYVIEKYVVDVDVRENNSFRITETIDVNFFEYSNGIYRTLPEKSSVKFSQDGKEYDMKYRIDYSAVNSDLLYDSFSENDCFFIQLGANGANYFGNKAFELSYIISLGDDRLTKFDQFYYNIIGNYWDTIIKKVEMTISFPKPVENEMFLYIGDYGSESGTKINHANTSKTSFKYSFDQPLQPGQGVTARVVLDEGYFNISRSYLFDIILLSIALLLLLKIFISYKKRNNPAILVPVVNFEPPKNVNSAEVGYIIDGRVDNCDVASLIVYWASKGFIKIREEKKKLFLSKIKEADSAMKEYEKKLFDKIFNIEGEIDVDDLGQKIYMEVIKLKKQIEAENKNKVFKPSAIIARNSIAICSALLFALVTIKINYQLVETIRLIVGIAISLLWYVALAILVLIKDKVGTYNEQKKKTKIILFSVASIIIIVAYSIFTYNFYCDPFFLTFISVFIAIISIVLIYKFNVRTDEGLKMQGQLIGLRQFIELAEKDRLEMLVKDDPQAFYNILPFAYVLGVSDVWIKKFENISLEIPSWYVSDQNNLTSYLIICSLNNNLRTLNTNMNSLPISNSTSGNGFGGSIGGGGFSGGGFGGGGGGRW